MADEEPEERKIDEPARLALVLLCAYMKWEQADLAREARIAPSQASVYLRGKRAVPPEVLARAVFQVRKTALRVAWTVLRVPVAMTGISGTVILSPLA
jgi:hypothetical protein